MNVRRGTGSKYGISAPSFALRISIQTEIKKCERAIPRFLAVFTVSSTDVLRVRLQWKLKWTSAPHLPQVFQSDDESFRDIKEIALTLSFATSNSALQKNDTHARGCALHKVSTGFGRRKQEHLVVPQNPSFQIVLNDHRFERLENI